MPLVLHALLHAVSLRDKMIDRREMLVFAPAWLARNGRADIHSGDRYCDTSKETISRAPLTSATLDCGKCALLACFTTLTLVKTPVQSFYCYLATSKTVDPAPQFPIHAPNQVPCASLNTRG